MTGTTVRRLGLLVATTFVVAVMATPSLAASKPRVSATASVTSKQELVVRGRVTPARSSWRVRVQARVSLVRNGRARPRWVKRADSRRLPRSGRFVVRTPAHGTSVTLRVKVIDRRGRTVAVSRTVAARRKRTLPPPADVPKNVDGAETPVVPDPPGTAAQRNSLASGATLEPGQELRSPNGEYRLVQQADDGNLVLYRGATPLWGSGGQWGAGSRTAMQGDGNLVIYTGSTPRWSSNTAGFDGASLHLQDDGNLVIYYRGRAIWTWGAGYFGDTLAAGVELPPGAVVRSSDGKYKLVMQADDGNLVLYHNSGVPLWGSGPRGRGARAVMQTDGNFVIYGAAGAAWTTNGAGFPGANLVVQNDSNVVSYHSGHAIWTRGDGYVGDRLGPGATLLPGAYLKSPNKQFTLVMQHTDGNLVIYGPGGAVWGWSTNGSSTRRAVMQTDGNFVVYDGYTAIKASGTTGRTGAYIRVQDDSNLVIYVGGTAIWDRGRGLLSGGGGQLPSGGDGSYPHAGAVNCSAQFGIYSWCVNGTWLSSRGYGYRNCTDWAAWRLQQMGASDASTRGLGHGGQWGARAGAARTSGTPLRGRAAVKPTSGSDSFGHVAVVEAVHGDGQITVSEYNAAGTGTYRTWTGYPSQRGFSQFVDFGIS